MTAVILPIKRYSETMKPEDVRPRIDDLRWWHSIEVSTGVVTPGGWDLRPTARKMPWPAVAGKRCLDVGTMDGFWAFEMEARGASEVVATDLLRSREHDVPAGHPHSDTTRSNEAFNRARELRNSAVMFEECNVYDLDPSVHGLFDIVMMGYVLQMVRDPLRVLVALRSVCRGHLLLLDTVSAPLSLLPSPLARLSARHGYSEWFVFNRACLCRAVTLAGFTVEAVTGIIRDHPGAAIKSNPLPRRRRFLHAVGILGCSCALRASPSIEPAR